jgi:hypothetical protein
MTEGCSEETQSGIKRDATVKKELDRRTAKAVSLRLL